MTPTEKRGHGWGRHHFVRVAHFSWLWFVVIFVIVNGFLRNRAVVVVSIGVLIGALAVFGMIRTCDRGHLVPLRMEDPLLALAGAFVTGAGIRWLHLPLVLAIAVPGVIGGLAVRRIAGPEDLHGAPIYCAAFAAGTSIAVLVNPWWILLAGFIAGVLWSVGRDAWAGIGGKMGLVALMGTLIVVALAWSVHQLGPGAPPLNSRNDVVGVLIFATLGAGLTWWLAFRLGWGPVLGSAVSSGLVALALSLVPHLSSDSANVLDVAWFGGSFVGMTNPTRLARPLLTVPLAGFVYGGLQVSFGHHMAGMGGIVGTTALIAVFTVRGALGVLGVADATRRAARVLWGAEIRRPT